MMRYVDIAVLIVAILALSGRAAAQPTPTFTPGPTATSTGYIAPTGEFGGLRPTPTGLSITPSPIALDLSGKAGEFADTAINMYRWINFGADTSQGTGGVIDFILFGAMGYFIIRALIYIINNFRGD